MAGISSAPATVTWLGVMRSGASSQASTKAGARYTTTEPQSVANSDRILLSR